MEKFNFDKFMDNIVVKERKQERTEQDETAQRIRMRRYAETPANRIRYVKKEGSR